MHESYRIKRLLYYLHVSAMLCLQFGIGLRVMPAELNSIFGGTTAEQFVLY